MKTLRGDRTAAERKIRPDCADSCPAAGPASCTGDRRREWICHRFR
ncbi:hypothetical protein CL3_08320 [butyrate-producing bacterium SM4/1]|nr:hypothetical protein CLS_11400 [[Clostridium] cf. saccharolyticum K10]CBL35831.1 hypothetical protein CL3_08320 [butyrate-producing bacterium SM4/1]